MSCQREGRRSVGPQGKTSSSKKISDKDHYFWEGASFHEQKKFFNFVLGASPGFVAHKFRIVSTFGDIKLYVRSCNELGPINPRGASGPC